MQVGCVQVIRASWGSELRVYAGRSETRIVDAVFVRAREVSSTEHGDLTIHTRRGLRVGNSERRLRRLYPRAKHGGHTHYRLATAPSGAYLMAKVVDHDVVQLEAWPYELRDKACVDECPVDCIYEGARMLYIQPEECVDCDAWVPVCPVTAIFTEDDVPGEWKQFTAVNAEWFSDAVTGLGSPGGAAQVGPQDKDHPVVAGWSQVA